MSKILNCFLFAGVTCLFIPVIGLCADTADVNGVAESYVKLVLKVGLYDPDYIDKQAGKNNNINKQWELFGKLLILPQTPSDLSATSK